MDAIKGSARVSVKLTSTSEIPALSKLFLLSERQLLVLRFETSHDSRQLLAGYGNQPEPAIPDKSVFDLAKAIVDVHLPVQRHGI